MNPILTKDKIFEHDIRGFKVIFYECGRCTVENIEVWSSLTWYWKIMDNKLYWKEYDDSNFAWLIWEDRTHDVLLYGIQSYYAEKELLGE